MHHAGLWRTGLCAAWLFACGHKGSHASEVRAGEEIRERRVMLLGETTAPVFFLGAQKDAAAVGFGSADAKLILLGESDNGRTLVRVHGRVTLEAYVPDELFELRAQRSIRVVGTPVLAAANDRLRLRGSLDEAGNVPVAAHVRVGEVMLGPFEGLAKLAYLSANISSNTGDPLKPGILYTLPPKTPLPLFQVAQGELLTLVPAQEQPVPVEVLSIERNWFSVRLGSGPYVEGVTNAPLVLSGANATTDLNASSGAEANAENTSVPRRIAQAEGALKRVAPTTEVSFRGQPLATFRSAGWARVIGTAPNEQVEVLAAADDQVTLRGLVAAETLRDANETELGDAVPAAAPGEGAPLELSSAVLANP